jgi:ATP-binding cassette subfamily C protein
MVLLGAEWWTHDTGPLVGYLGAEARHPVALLPRGRDYDIVDPERRGREPLTPELRAQLCPDAHMFYRPLPDRLLRIPDLLRFTLQGRVRDTLFVLTMGILATLLSMLVPKVTGVLVDSAIPNADHSLLWQLWGLLSAAGLAGAAFTFAQVMATVRVSTMAEVVAQSAMWDRLLKFRPSFYREYSSGDLQTRVNAVGEVSRDLSGATLRPLISGALALLNFLLLWYYSWELAKLAIWLGLAVLVVTMVVGYYIRQRSFRLHDLEGILNGLMIQMIGGVGKVRVAGAEHRAFHHWVSRYTEQLRLSLSIQRLKDLISVFNLVLPPVAAAFLFWKATDLTIKLPITDPARIGIGDFIAFNTAFVLYLTGWTDVSKTLVSVLDALIKGRRIQPILEGTPEVAADATDPGRLTGYIRSENVSFRYHADGPLILDRVTFEARPGEFVAFVGPSGSGKSTVLRLLLGFERPEYGRILYDGQDLGGLDVLAVRRQIGTVLQNGRLNAGSIFDNISNNAQITHGEAWDAVADAGMSGDIELMPMGLHTMVAEGGANLSGGQRQRLLIARALAVRPKLVFFDEATSALDNQTQAIVSAALERRKVTRLVIAHRLSTIRQADRIYVLESGRVVQVGSFEDLSQQEGLFRDLMSRQMA